MALDAKFPEALQFLFEPHRYKVIYGGRGKGGSWGFGRAALVMGVERPLRILCGRETMKSIAYSVHALLHDQIRSMGLEHFYEVLEYTIRGKNGTEFLFEGLKHNIGNIKSAEAVDICWVEEAQNVSRDTWETLIPTIRKEHSEIWVGFNPVLENDDTHVRFVLKPPPGAKVVKMSWRDNPWFPEVLRIEMEHLKATDHRAYMHVWEGECKSAVEGAIYQDELNDAEMQGRIGVVSHDPTKPVSTAWDLGFNDTNSIWFFQVVAGQYRFIDYMEDRGKTIAYYIIELGRKPYMYDVDWVPHDASDAIIHTKLAGGDRSRSIEQLMRAAGRKVRIVPKMLVRDGINAARTIFPLCYFDRDRCADGLQGLRHYQWGPIAASGQERAEPLHDWASHPADGFRTAAVVIKAPKLKEHKPAEAPMRTTAWS